MAAARLQADDTAAAEQQLRGMVENAPNNSSCAPTWPRSTAAATCRAPRNAN
ncbi:hypothetical protein WJ971_25340 [Achromobacter xylosoxidans]